MGYDPRLDKQIFIFQTPRGAPAKPIGAAKDKSPQKPAPYLQKKRSFALACSSLSSGHNTVIIVLKWCGRARGRSFTNPRPLGLGLNCYPVLCVCVCWLATRSCSSTGHLEKKGSSLLIYFPSSFARDRIAFTSIWLMFLRGKAVASVHSKVFLSRFCVCVCVRARARASVWPSNRTTMPKATQYPIGMLVYPLARGPIRIDCH